MLRVTGFLAIFLSSEHGLVQQDFPRSYHVKSFTLFHDTGVGHKFLSSQWLSRRVSGKFNGELFDV